MAQEGWRYILSLNEQLPDKYECKLSSSGRIYYTSHLNQFASWVPPRENWHPGNGLPYGWEEGVDKNDKPYFINHIEKYTTRNDPRDDPDYVEPPEPRSVHLLRDAEKGFGFVAGSERPVVVRFVTDGGPSVDKLLPGDQIIKINGEDVKKAPRDYVIDLVRSCQHSIILTVCQPYVENLGRRSAFLTPAKKARLKNNPSRVRFADAVFVNGTPVISPSSQESYVPLMPNVLKVFLENGQTKSFKYDNKTTVKDVINSLQEKLNIKCIQYFSLVLHNLKSHIPFRMAILQEHETLAEIAARPGSRHFRCLFRVTFVPRDAYNLLKEDTTTFEYFYMQCCTDVVQERFASELKYDTIFRLAALHIHQHVISKNVNAKVSLKAVEKECGFEKFLPRTLLDNMRRKDVRKMLLHCLKINQGLTVPGQKQLTALQAKLHYLKILNELKIFGARVFLVTLLDKKSDNMILVGPKSGISMITNIKSYKLSPMAEFDQIKGITVTKEGDNMQKIEVDLKGNHSDPLSLGFLNDDVQDFLAIVEGYFRLLVDSNETLLDRVRIQNNCEDPDTPAYSGKHRVLPASWSYPDDCSPQIADAESEEEVGKLGENEHIIDLSKDPPQYEENEEFITKISEETKYQNGHKTTKSDKEPEEMEHDSNTPFFANNKSSQPQMIPARNSLHQTPELDQAAVNSKLNCEEEISIITNSVNNEKERLISDEDASVMHTGTESVDQFRTFKRYVPSPISSHAKRLKDSQKGATASVVSHDELLQIELNSQPKLLQGEEGFSDTDSGSGTDAERKPLLSVRDSLTLLQSSRSIQHGSDQEGSDSDSWGTPSGSPARTTKLDSESRSSKIVVGSQNSEADDHGQLEFGESSSFGLHSPDQLPGEMLTVVCNTECFHERGLCLDPDIIDLTLIPPPETIEDGSNIDFCFMTSDPPPGFSDEVKSAERPIASLSLEQKQTCSVKHSPLSKQQAPTPARLRTQAKKQLLVKSASVDHCSRLLHSDIDALIAKLTMPPPPADNSLKVGISERALSQSWSESIGRGNQEAIQAKNQLSLEEEIASLVVPPPPVSLSSESVSTAPFASQQGTDRPHSFTVRRSSSVDSLLIVDHYSKDAISDHILPKSFSPHNVLSSSPSSHNILQLPVSDVQVGKAIESPASVSAKLKTLLQSIPGSHENSSRKVLMCQSDTNKLNTQLPSKLYRSNSCHLYHNRSPVTDFKGTQPRLSSSVATTDTVANIRHFSKSVNLDEERNNPKNNTSETFAALKSKLQAYRDFLLNRKAKTEANRSGSYQRSNSFSLGSSSASRKYLSFGRMNKNSSSIENALELEKSTTCLAHIHDSHKKSTLLMQGISTLPISTLRPKVNPAKSQEGTKPGPLKALQNLAVITSPNSLRVYGTSPSDPNPLARTNLDLSEINSDLSLSLDLFTMNGKKLKNNPYSTVRIWRPAEMSNQSSEEPIQASTHYTSFKRLWESFKGRKSDDTGAIHKTSESCNNNSEWNDFQVKVCESNQFDRCHTGSKMEILAKTYATPEDVSIACKDIERLLFDLKKAMESLKESEADKSHVQFELCKAELFQHVQQHVKNSKFFVMNAALTSDKLTCSLSTGMHSLANIFLHCHTTMLMVSSVHHAQQLGFEVIKMTNAFKSTVHAAFAAAGKANDDPHVHYLMQQAQQLASLLRSLLSAVKGLEYQ